MDHRFAAALLTQQLFEVIDRVVQQNQVSVSRNFRMQRDHPASRAVIVYDKVMHADHAVLLHYDMLNFLNKLLRRGLPKQGADGLLRGANAGIADEHRNQEACVTVDLPPCPFADQHGKQNDRSRGHIGKAVQRRCAHRRGIDLFADAAVIKEHIELREDRDDQHAHRKVGKRHRFRVDDLIDRSLAQLEAHQQDRHRNDESCDILKSAVSERMLFIRLRAGEPKPDQRDGGAARVGEVVECIRRDADAAGQRSRNQLAGKEENVEQNPDRTAENTVFQAHIRVFEFLVVFDDQFGK